MAIISCPYTAPINTTIPGTTWNAVKFQAVVTKGSVDRTYNVTFQAKWANVASLWNTGNVYLKILINNDKRVGDVTRHHPSLTVSRTTTPTWTFVDERDKIFEGINHDTSWINIYSCVINAAQNNKVIVNEIQVDTSKTTGDNKFYGGSNKPGVALDANNNATYGSIYNWDFKVEDDPSLTWGSKPTVSNLRNNNPYKYDMDGTQKTMNNVSEYIDGIYVKCDLNNGGGWVGLLSSIN